MPRYAALLRGVAPSIVKNADLLRAFEAAGFSEVRTVLSSGNVVFTARAAAAATLETLIERTLGTDVTTRTWETVGKIARVP